MKKYRVNVNGVDYEVAIEALKDGETFAPASAPAAAPAASAPAASAPAPAAPAASAPAAAPAAAPAPAGGEQVNSPMPGTVLSIAAPEGTTVKAGQVVLVLEAMKMENEIVSPCDGRVASVNVTKGSTVESGTLLFVIA